VIIDAGANTSSMITIPVQKLIIEACKGTLQGSLLKSNKDKTDAG